MSSHGAQLQELCDGSVTLFVFGRQPHSLLHHLAHTPRAFQGYVGGRRRGADPALLS